MNKEVKTAAASYIFGRIIGAIIIATVAATINTWLGLVVLQYLGWLPI